jgi:hypothetical protein
MTDSASRYSLRDLPFPAKLVVTCFLIAVGGGYLAAMVQLHMQDAKSGEAMPTVHDVIMKYTGKKWFEKDPPRPVSKLEKLIMGPTGKDAAFGGMGSMGPAFFDKDPSQGPKNYKTLIQATPAKKPEIDAQREGERQVLKAWINSDEGSRRSTFEADKFVTEQPPKAIDDEWRNGDGFKVKSIFETRCVACHGQGGPQDRFPLETYEQIERYLVVAAHTPVGPNGGWVKVEEPIGLEKLTQSTHAHLLSFAVLFSLTGLVFAFTSINPVLRCVLAPWVLVAVVVDVSLWWAARLSDQWGPYFAMGIIGTGAAAGVGLMLQIVLSLLNMYGARGKAVVLALFALAAVAGWQLYVHRVKPGLEAKRVLVKADPADAHPKDGGPKKDDPKKDGAPVVPNGAGGAVAKMLTLPAGADVLKLPWKKGEPGGMARAFFDKDGAEFAAAVRKKDDATQKMLMPERHGERDALLAWSRLPDPDRRKAFDADAFPLPADWGKRPITADYLKGGAVKVQSIVTDRCVRCHADDETAAFADYESLSKYLK